MAKKQSPDKGWKKIESGSMIDWDKQKNVPVIGKLVSVEIKKSKTTKKGEKSKPYKLFKVETDKGQVCFTGSQLETKLEGVKTGQRVKIQFIGKQKTKKFKMNAFDVWIR